MVTDLCKRAHVTISVLSKGLRATTLKRHVQETHLIGHGSASSCDSSLDLTISIAILKYAPLKMRGPIEDSKFVASKATRQNYIELRLT